ncbi:response regulator [Halalkalibacter krulwichiae]|uniref:Transcriptional regulatory protein DpiA n=1 Tax=Halalkalibacter krulwichiae TaxID=199441 RepID=A0A1X9M9M5_9BACI|nr:response regulator [Halalkalibacter krulwichiae]ARK28873.1 Transcriptional regulatory protein DpiA [Halalkalibacter krulwichiae]
MISTFIVEDDPMVAQINAEYLSKMTSFSLVGTSKNGKDALNQIRLLKPQLILLDVYIPDYNGIELLRKMRSENLSIDVILITAADAPEIIEEAMRLGVVDCILKPYAYVRFESSLSLYMKRQSIFHSVERVQQADLDQLYSSAQKEFVIDLPKGIDPVTLTIIRDELKKAATPYSITELSKVVNISTLTVRKYIEYMIQRNEIELDLEYSEKGRPKKLYSFKG